MRAKNLYIYEPIQNDEIRLLKFIRDDDHRISAVLQAFSVGQPLPEYNSISYTWSLDEATGMTAPTLEMEGRQLPILDTIRPFFDALRGKEILLDDTWWWIDSICIDLSNVQERAQQVQHMQFIYRHAKQVIVWLGQASDDSDLAIDFIKFIHKTIHRQVTVPEIRAMLQQDHYNAQWRALTGFLSRKWWSRIWTVQEFVVPESVSFWCGMGEASREAVSLSICMADICTSAGVKENPAFTLANNRRRAWSLYKVGRKQELTLTLLASAAYFSCMDATDDRDRLYGLIGLATAQSSLRVDYTKKAAEVYLQFTKSFIEDHKSLDIICFAATYSAPSGTPVPSWVPDWKRQNPYPQVIPSMVSQSSQTHIGNFRTQQSLDFDPSVYYSASGKREAVYQFEGSTLHARGFVVDVVDGIAGNKSHDMVQSSPSRSNPRSSSADILTSVCRSLVLDRKDRYLSYAMPVADFVRDFTCLLKRIATQPESSAPQELRQWFEWTRSLQIQGLNFEGHLVDSPGPNDDDAAAAPNEDEYYQQTFFGRFYDVVVRLSFRLMVTSNGRIGMVIDKAMKGDLVCILFGCNVPILLRKSECGGSYRLIGECFLDGYMNGEALDLPDVVEQTFAIF
ncbi:heterokaryon incompatibility protein-domain-containing protein [Triangularia setosa]|uniref:Heterokaryon incompatibility protein-domain-containing protein n=1 Tax=Triangularia setosa TaxID=2587417 RepID=A0AAN7A2R3_9PEZI|nr:heterokaryon incompatibility protein-domain-containing protein [Podospora setosa]